MCQGFSKFSDFLQHFVLAKSAIISIRVDAYEKLNMRLNDGFFRVLRVPLPFTSDWSRPSQNIFCMNSKSEFCYAGYGL